MWLNKGYRIQRQAFRLTPWVSSHHTWPWILAYTYICLLFNREKVSNLRAVSTQLPLRVSLPLPTFVITVEACVKTQCLSQRGSSQLVRMFVLLTASAMHWFINPGWLTIRNFPWHAQFRFIMTQMRNGLLNYSPILAISLSLSGFHRPLRMGCLENCATHHCLWTFPLPHSATLGIDDCKCPQTHLPHSYPLPGLPTSLEETLQYPAKCQEELWFEATSNHT